MDGAPEIPFAEYSEWSCPRCHHDLARLPSTARFCPRCGENYKATPRADFVLLPPPAPEHFHSMMIVGYAKAMTQLGTRYELSHNTDEALRCYCKAARLGNSEARTRLITRGVAEFNEAAESNSPEPAATTAPDSPSPEMVGSAHPTAPDAPSDQPSPPVATEPQTP
jgi:hypothetical protein